MAQPGARCGQRCRVRGDAHGAAGAGAALALFASGIAGPYNGVVQRIAVTLPLTAKILIVGRMLTLPLSGSAAGIPAYVLLTLPTTIVRLSIVPAGIRSLLNWARWR